MTTRDKNDIVEIARRIRRQLRSEFPGVKFSVRTSRFSGGSSIDVKWTDGPTEKQVKPVAMAVADDKYEASYHIHEDYWSGSHYYHFNRGYSVDTLFSAASHFGSTWADFIDTPWSVEASHQKGQGYINTPEIRFSETVWRYLQNVAIADGVMKEVA